jgi:branched-chain amino acid transport system permease protein
VSAWFVLPSYLFLGTQILILVLFALSLDLILGYAGIVTLGHAAYFGLGAYVAGMLSAHAGWHEPITGLLLAGAVAAAFGWLSGLLLLRYHGLALLMLTIAVGIMLRELANVLEAWTGGFDGLYGITPAPLLGRFENDLFGRNYYAYSLIVLFLVFHDGSSQAALWARPLGVGEESHDTVGAAPQSDVVSGGSRA